MVPLFEEKVVFDEWMNQCNNQWTIGVVCEIRLRLSYMDIDVIIYLAVYHAYC